MSDSTPAARRPMKRGRLIGLAASLLAFAVLVSLGVWQLERLAWKQGLIAKVEARIHEAAVPVPEEQDWDKVGYEDDEYRRVLATGRFRHDLEVQVYTLADQTPDGGGGPGYWVITPLVTAEGAAILVNRGFVPMRLKDPASRAEGQTDGVATVTGLIRMPEEGGLFTPQNDPVKDAWYVRDPFAIGEAKGLLRVAPFLIDADGTANPGGWPQGGLTRIAFPNRHFEYALTWFGLAASLAGVGVAVLWRRRRRD
ncbi:SURF1 family protein [Ancylobacter defluvii]|uniref:SURF1-like protein n=1 Tax=Ancylobacter defluvii TaxID=1282440 RepID=A0A9W6NAZ7_9HYPH|nr:SURF1 family protein [Ancylobacter defluvii]GLK85014.1 SURF1-like protein [Ancylobacter defluvii]